MLFRSLRMRLWRVVLREFKRMGYGRLTRRVGLSFYLGGIACVPVATGFFYCPWIPQMYRTDFNVAGVILFVFFLFIVCGLARMKR